MHVKSVEEQSLDELYAHVVQVMQHPGESPWGMLHVMRDCMQPVANDDFVRSVRPSLQDTSRATIFFIDPSELYISWAGAQKPIQRKLENMIMQFWQPDKISSFDEKVHYFDPKTAANDLIFKIKQKRQEINEKNSGYLEQTNLHSEKAKLFLGHTDIQMAGYRQLRQQRIASRLRHMLIVDDQEFSRNLLHQILTVNSSVGMASGVKDGWQVFLDQAPDISFIDIGLEDGSGHSLAKAIRDFDPLAHIVMISADSNIENVTQAKQNKVNGYILKPFSRDKVNNIVQKYLVSLKSVS